MTVISKELKDLIRKNLHYIPSLGILTWKDSSPFRQFIGHSPVTESADEHGKIKLTVTIGTESFNAADVCWLLSRNRWPKHGVVTADKSPEGRRSLKADNLRLRRKPVYTKVGRAVCLPRILADKVLAIVRYAGESQVANEIMEVME